MRSNRLRTVLPVAVSMTCGLSAAAVMFALPGGAAPLPTGYSATARAEIWHLGSYDADASGDPSAELSVGRVDGIVGSRLTNRTTADSGNILGAPAASVTSRRTATSKTSSTTDTTAPVAGAAPAGTVPGILDFQTATLAARARWVGDTSCLSATEYLTDSRAVSQGSSTVPTTIPGEDSTLTIPVVDLEIPAPDGGDDAPGLPDLGLPPVDAPWLPPPTQGPTELPTELPLPTEIPSGLPTSLPTTLPPLPPIPGLPLRPATPSAATNNVVLAQAAPATVDQRAWLSSTGVGVRRAVRAEAVGTVTDPTRAAFSFLGGQAAVRITAPARLTAYADGINPGQVLWTPPAMSLAVSGQASPISVPIDGTPVRVSYGNNKQVVLTLSAGELVKAVSPTGLSATGAVSTLHAVIARTTAGGTKTMLDAELFPLAVEAKAPAGGVECVAASSLDDDQDGLTNGVETQLGTDPRRKDTDRDGLTDGQEVKRYRTSPRRADTDRDHLKDGAEVKRYKTKPRKADTDRDHLKDGAEVRKHKTDPRKRDTDRDGVNDDVEIRRGTNPNKKG